MEIQAKDRKVAATYAHHLRLVRGFDSQLRADRVDRVEISDSDFLRNLDDGIELFPAGDDVPPDEQPDDFPGRIREDFSDLKFEANVGEDIERPPTED